MAAAILTMGITGGCGTAPQQSPERPIEETAAEPTEAVVETEAQIGEETQPQQTPQETEMIQETEAPDTEEYIDHPIAEGGEGDTNGFYDDAGTWVTVYKNPNGDWVDESGMVYIFGDDGVTDEHGVFYPY